LNATDTPMVDSPRMATFSIEADTLASPQKRLLPHSSRAEFDLSVKYGADQPEYDLFVVRGDAMPEVSMKESKGSRWELIQSFPKTRTIRLP
jgi:hypothetical protein